jgi:hypothetical protein
MWVMTGVVLGLVAYAGVVLMLIAGYSSVLPLVVVPLILGGLIGANNLLGGGRTYGRTPGRPVGSGQAPLSSSGPNGPLPDTTEEPMATGAETSAGPVSPVSPVSQVSPVSPVSPGAAASPDVPGNRA